MSNRFKRAVIDDVTPRNIDASLQDHLLDLFESAMKSVATTLVREAKFDTTDFATAANGDAIRLYAFTPATEA